MVLQVLFGFVEEALLHGLEQLRHLGLQRVERHGELFAVVSSRGDADARLDVPGAELQAQRHAFHLPLGKLPAGGVVRKVALYAETRSLQALHDLLCGLGHAGLVRGYRQDDDLDRRDPRREDQTVIVAVGHDDAADDPGGHAPARLVRVAQLVFLIRERDVEGLCKAVSEVVAGAGLQGLAVMHHALDGIGVFRAGELFFLGLVALDDGHGQPVLADVGVDLQHPERFLPGLFLCGVDGVALLPEELAAAEEGARRLFPAEHAAPLVIEAGQVPPGVYDMAPVLAEESLRGGAYAQPLGQLLTAANRHPGALGGETLYVVLLLLEQALGYEHGHGNIRVPGLLEFPVQRSLDVFPNRVAVGSQNKEPLYARIVHELRLGADVCEPLGKIDFHVGYLFYLLILRHI